MSRFWITASTGQRLQGENCSFGALQWEKWCVAWCRISGRPITDRVRRPLQFCNKILCFSLFLTMILLYLWWQTSSALRTTQSRLKRWLKTSCRSVAVHSYIHDDWWLELFLKSFLTTGSFFFLPLLSVRRPGLCQSWSWVVGERKSSCSPAVWKVQRLEANHGTMTSCFILLRHQ